jgi:hypothetical protein
LISERRIIMPNYRNGEYEKHRKPMWRDEQERKNRHEPERDDDEDVVREDWRPAKGPCPNKFIFPFKVEVRVIPCDDFKHPQ